MAELREYDSPVFDFVNEDEYDEMHGSDDARENETFDEENPPPSTEYEAESRTTLPSAQFCRNNTYIRRV